MFWFFCIYLDSLYPRIPLLIKNSFWWSKIFIFFCFTFILQILSLVVLLLLPLFRVFSQLELPLNRYIFGKDYFLPGHLLCLISYSPVFRLTQKMIPCFPSFQVGGEILRSILRQSRKRQERIERWMTSRLWKLKMFEGQKI